jgi:hypothetical protein
MDEVVYRPAYCIGIPWSQTLARTEALSVVQNQKPARPTKVMAVAVERDCESNVHTFKAEFTTEI